MVIVKYVNTTIAIFAQISTYISDENFSLWHNCEKNYYGQTLFD